MSTLKTNWLRAIGILTLALGLFFGSKAISNSNTENIIVPLEELVYVHFDSNGEAIPIPDGQLDDYTHPANSNPFSCPNGTGNICSGAYSLSDLEQNANGDWVPKTSATASYVRKYN